MRIERELMTQRKGMWERRNGRTGRFTFTYRIDTIGRIPAKGTDFSILNVTVLTANWFVNNYCA